MELETLTHAQLPAVHQPHRPKTTAEQLARLVSAGARALVPEEAAREYCFLPVSLHADTGGEFIFGLSACSEDVLRDLSKLLGRTIQCEAAPAEAIRSAIELAYRGHTDELLGLADCADGPKQPRLENADAETSEAAVPRLLSGILFRARRLESSDIHFEPMGEQRPYRVRFRVHGRLREDEDLRLSANVVSQLVRHLKVLCRSDISAPTAVVEGGFTKSVCGGRCRYRVSIVPGIMGESVVIRQLHSNFVASLQQLPAASREAFSVLGMSLVEVRRLESFLRLRGGVILTSGPTGSGKSTLLYAIAHYLNEEHRSIVSLEDPVEFILPGVRQTQVNQASGLDFADYLPAILRQDPDVILIGEIRNKKTAELALQAGLTGHLVCSTVHAGSCFEILPRLASMGVSDQLVDSAISLLIAQRLVACNCPHCARETSAPAFIRQIFSLPESARVTTSLGCPLCFHTGTAGRRAIFDMLSLDEYHQGLNKLEQQYNVRASTARVALLGKLHGFARPIKELLCSGIISPQTATEVLGIDSNFGQHGLWD